MTTSKSSPKPPQPAIADKPMGTRIKIDSDGYATVCGIDFETRRIEVVARSREAIVLKVPGRSCWSGNYTPREYVSPKLMVYQIVADTPKDLRVVPVIE